MISLTARQADALRFIQGFQERFGFSPSREEIRAGLGLGSSSTAHRLVVRLQERGAIRVLPNRDRAIEVLIALPLPRAADGEPLFFVRVGERV